MTEAELTALERDTDRPGPVLDLVAEVRRLRGLVKGAEDAAGADHNCPWCGYEIDRRHGHSPKCPAFTPDGDVR